MSESMPSSKRTRTFRANVLLPAGCVFPKHDESPKSQQAFWDDLSDFDHSLPQSMQAELANEKLPASVFSDSSVLTEVLATQIVALAKEVRAYALEGEVDNYIEELWTNRCHSVALRRFEKQTMMDVLANEALPAVTIREGVIISLTKPDFCVAYRVDGNEAMQRETLDDFLLERRLDPYLNNAKMFAFPLIAVESKSAMGVPYEAENQCAESVIKMLHKLLQFQGSTGKLPVFCITFVGSTATVYMATTEMRRSKIVYRIQQFWTGTISYLWTSIQFQIVLWKLERWIKGVALDEITEALRALSVTEK